MPLATAENAVRRELAADFGIRSAEPRPVFNCAMPFYYPDKENLFFYVFSQEVPSTYQFASDAQMFSWTVDELLKVRRYHVLTNCKIAVSSGLTPRQRSKASELLTESLIAQGDGDLAQSVSAAIIEGSCPSDLESTIDARSLDCKVVKYTYGRELSVEGLAGLQYRAFYSALLPVYASVGMERAEQYLDELSHNDRRQRAITAMNSMYLDTDFMSALPVEV